MSKLADLIHGASKEQEAAELSAILGDGSRDAEGRGAFSKACEVARQETADSEFSKAQNYLLAHPYLVDSPGGQGTFFEKFPHASMDRLREIVGRLREARYPSNTDGDLPEAEAGRIARRTMAR